MPLCISTHTEVGKSSMIKPEIFTAKTLACSVPVSCPPLQRRNTRICEKNIYTQAVTGRPTTAAQAPGLAGGGRGGDPAGEARRVTRIERAATACWSHSVSTSSRRHYSATTTTTSWRRWHSTATTTTSSWRRRHSLGLRRSPRASWAANPGGGNLPPVPNC